MSDFLRCGGEFDAEPRNILPLGVRCGLLLLGGRGLWCGGGVAIEVSSRSGSMSILAIMEEDGDLARSGDGCFDVFDV